jgi:thymidylate synthase
MVPDQLIGNLGDVHLYTNHIEQSKDQIGRELDIIERINYGVNILGYESLLDYGHSQNEDELITKLCDEFGVPKRTREPYPLPTLKIKSINDNHMIYPKLLPLTGEEEFYEISDFILENYQSHPTIKAPLSN